MRTSSTARTRSSPRPWPQQSSARNPGGGYGAHLPALAPSRVDRRAAVRVLVAVARFVGEYGAHDLLKMRNQSGWLSSLPGTLFLIWDEDARLEEIRLGPLMSGPVRNDDWWGGLVATMEGFYGPAGHRPFAGQGAREGAHHRGSAQTLISDLDA